MRAKLFGGLTGKTYEEQRPKENRRNGPQSAETGFWQRRLRDTLFVLGRVLGQSSRCNARFLCGFGLQV